MSERGSESMFLYFLRLGLMGSCLFPCVTLKCSTGDKVCSDARGPSPCGIQGGPALTGKTEAASLGQGA